MWKNYIFGGIAVPFAAAFASGKHSKMVKRINSIQIDKVLKGLRNATWDITTLHYWTHHVTKRASGEPFYFLCSADRGLRAVANNIMRCQDQDNSDEDEFFALQFKNLLSAKEIMNLKKFYIKLANNSDNPSRAIEGYRANKEFFYDYISELENEVRELVDRRCRATRD